MSANRTALRSTKAHPTAKSEAPTAGPIDPFDNSQNVEIGDRAFRFGELTPDGFRRLREWIGANVPNPLQAIKGQLDGFSEAEKASLLRGAYEDFLHWPPEATSQEGLRYLFDSPDGHLALIQEALRVHQPDAPKTDVEWVYQQTRRNDSLAMQIVGLMFNQNLANWMAS